MKTYILEVCVDSADSAAAAETGGANRLELCSGLVIGGVTPTARLFQQVRGEFGGKIHVLVRPRFGDFCYTEREFGLIREEVEFFKKLGADGVVIGCLKSDGSLDTERLGILKEAAGPLSVTLHRAFDVCRDPFEALEQCVELGIRTILTSGCAQNCTLGQDFLTRLARKAAGRIDIMAGGGINAEVIETLQPLTGITSFHMSGKKSEDSVMTYRKNGISMGFEGLSEYEIWRTDAEKIRTAVGVLERL